MRWIDYRYVIVSVVIVVCLNEYTLVVLDSTPPLSAGSVTAIRILDFLVLLCGLLSKYLVAHFRPVLGKASKLVMSYTLPVCIAIVALDLLLRVAGLGYPSHYRQENIERFPTPYDHFRGKPNVADHNRFGFRGDFNSSDSSYNVAIFGGSTTYAGSPPIIDMVSNELNNRGINVETFNFGSVSSNHSQHVHRLLEFSDRFKFDLVIFYGGGNESLQYAHYDPRPGYPYNFFFRNDLSPWKQTLLRFSSIASTVDLFTGGSISGLSNLKKGEIDTNWEKEIVERYWRDLSLAGAISQYIVQPNICERTRFLSILQPANPATDLGRSVWQELALSQDKITVAPDSRHIDLTHLGDSVEFTDIIHVTQQSRELIAGEIANIVGDIYESECR